MAIVFISPRKKQKILIFSTIGLISLILISIGLGVFLIKPKIIPPEQVFIPPEIEINFGIFESDQLKNLELFGKIETEFNYQGSTKTGEIQSGRILASSQEKAIELLEQFGLFEIILEEMPIGRINPFVFYEIPPLSPEEVE